MSIPSPIDPDRYLGAVRHATATEVRVNLPLATARPERRGQARGAVGDFVFIDCERQKILGRIVETGVAERERLSLEPHLGAQSDPNPVGRVRLLAAMDQGSTRLQRGLSVFPRIGDSVYLAAPALLGQLLNNAVSHSDELTLDIGYLDAGDRLSMRLPPEKLFGRHCGVFGATGGGKSWTLATLIQQLKAAGGKAIVFDPTGEFANIASVDQVFVFEPSNPSHQQVHFPYEEMTEDDLFTLLRPSGQSQGPKLREAIKSLKLVRALKTTKPTGLFIENGLIKKQQKPRQPYFDALMSEANEIHNPLCNFDIRKLADQIAYECIYDSDKFTTNTFGDVDKNSQVYCEPLIARINTLVFSSELACLFSKNGDSLAKMAESFISDNSKSIALISFQNVRFEHNTREILLNVIGRYLLKLARQGKFMEKPLIVFLDEAHQFLGRVIGDDFNSTRLDAFGLIAKEGRKYGLTCVLATQRPRDIPQDVLSQLGTLFVHRLTNDQDRETVERACGDLDRSAAQFIPMLAPGEAVLIGPDLPAPVPIVINRPASPPDSRGPAFQKYWRHRQTTARASGRSDMATTSMHSEQPSSGYDEPTHSDRRDDDIPF